jgi:hypothetical protein
MIVFEFLGNRGDMQVRTGSITSIYRGTYPDRLVIGAQDVGTINVVDTDGLFATVCRAMAECDEYAKAAAEVAAEMIS